MKEAIMKTGTTVEIIDSPIPKAGPNQVVIKVAYSGSNPKDWKYPEWMPDKGQINQGDDIAGTVHEVGQNVFEFAVGDRVGAFHQMLTPHGSYAEYSLAWDWTTFHVPDDVSFEEVAAIPLAAMTACFGLFHHDQLNLPAPWQASRTSQKKTPLIIYGGASAVGSYAIQLARRAEIHPIIAIAGRGQDHVSSMLDKSKGDAVIDYRKGDEAVMSGIREAARAAGVEGKLLHAYDAVSEKETQTNLLKVLDKGGIITTVLPGRGVTPPEGVKSNLTYVGASHESNPAMNPNGHTEEDRDFAYIYFRYLARGLQQGWFKGHNPEVVPGGLAGVEQALNNLKSGKASAVKYVFKIADTPGVGN